jgi:acyl-ACP thioesterase
MEAFVTSYDVGASLRLKYSMILKLLQEAAGRQLAGEGFGYEFLRDNGAVFLLTKVDVEIKDLPAGGDTITVETWFRGLRGAQFVRDMRISGASGETLAECETLWITVDPGTHKILRPASFSFPEIVRPYKDDQVNIRQHKADTADILESEWVKYKREVRWSDIDCNAHMNNAVYADLICDCFPGGLGERNLEYFSITFAGEALEGAEIDIKTAMTKSGYAVYEGKVGEKRCFEAVAR